MPKSGLSGRRRRTLSPPTDLPPVRRCRWSIRFLVSFALLVALVVVAISWPTWLAPTGAAVAVSAAGLVLGLLGAASTVAVVFCWWHLRLEFCAWRPGPVTVLPFKDNTVGGDEPSAARTAELKARFEHHLVRCRFTRVTPAPSAESTTDFLQVIDAASDDLRGPWGALLRSARLFAPVSAYQVACTVQPGRPDSPHVLVIEVRRVAGPSIAPVIVEAPDAERAVELAAHEVAARILPRTEMCRQAPWTLWRDRRLPTELYDSYQRFQVLQADRYFDEAMAALRNAVRLDPENLSIRLDLGKLQERMQLYLDALLTYDDIITVAAQTDLALWRWWSISTPIPLPRSRLVRRGTRVLDRFDVVILIAQYRHALLLGLSETLASQWWGRPERCVTGAHQTSREWRRAHLREALGVRFTNRYGYLIDPDHPRRRPFFLESLREVDTDEERDRRTAAARLFFTSLSRLEFDHLIDDWTGSWIWWRFHAVLPPDAIKLGRPWSALRYRMAVSWAERAGHAELAGTRMIDASLGGDSALVADLADGRWPPEEAEIERSINQIGKEAIEPRTWRSHFNAACVLSLPLLLDGPPPRAGGTGPRDELDEERKQKVTARAVLELDKAVRSVDGALMLRQRDWLLSEDPDLDHLREHREFKDFEAKTFGSIGRAVERGPDIHRWEQSAYVARFINAAAGEMAALWRRRRRRVSHSPSDWSSWLEEEMAGWGLAERLALDSRDSHTRGEVTRQIARTGRLIALQGPAVRHPNFSDVLLDRQIASMDGREKAELLGVRYHGHRGPDDGVRARVARAIRSSDRRLDRLAQALREPLAVSACGCTLGRPSVLGNEELVLRTELIEGWRADVSSPAVLVGVREWCDTSSLRWEALSSWFDDELFGRGSVVDRGNEFREAITTRWWTT